MLKEQECKCKICKREIYFYKGKQDNTGKAAVIDHCHTNGNIRGVLCGACNTGLGAFRDNTEFLREAIKYLQ